jgi:hypothetical protein
VIEMSSIEGRIEERYAHNATYYSSTTTTDATWTDLSFIDHNGDSFVATSIFLRCATNPIKISFDPRDDGSHPVTQGVLVANQDILMTGKQADGIRVARNTGSNGTIEVWAWK